MVDLYNRIHRTSDEFSDVADGIAALDPDGRAKAMAGFDSHWTRFERAFGGLDSFRAADRGRRTRFLLDLIAAQERDRRADRPHAASGANLLTLLLRGVKYATRREVERMWERICVLRGPQAQVFTNAGVAGPGQSPTVH